MKENCQLLIDFFNKCKGKSTEEIQRLRVCDIKGARAPSENEAFQSKYWHLVQDLGPNECQRAAVRIYFNSRYSTAAEFYTVHRQINRNVYFNKDNLYNSQLTNRVKYHGTIYSRKYVWKSYNLQLKL